MENMTTVTTAADITVEMAPTTGPAVEVPVADATVECNPEVLDGFLAEFANLAIKIPASVRETVKRRLGKRGLNPAAPQSDDHKAIIALELSTAVDKYKLKCERTKASAAKKRAEERVARICEINAAALQRAQLQ